MHDNLEISTCDSLKYKMDNTTPIVSIGIGKSISIKRVK